MDRFYSTLSLSMRARKLVYGFDTVKENIKSIHLLLLASDLSQKTAKEVNFLATKENIEVLNLDKTMEEISKLIGKKTGIIGICDEGFAAKLTSLYKETEETI